MLIYICKQFKLSRSLQREKSQSEKASVDILSVDARISLCFCLKTKVKDVLAQNLVFTFFCNNIITLDTKKNKIKNTESTLFWKNILYWEDWKFFLYDNLFPKYLHFFFSEWTIHLAKTRNNSSATSFFFQFKNSLINAHHFI